MASKRIQPLPVAKFGFVYCTGNKIGATSAAHRQHPYLRADFYEHHPELKELAMKIAAK